MIAALQEAWARDWRTTAPVGHDVRFHAPDRWVRFHHLPDSKRYPTDEGEYTEILNRHHQLLSALGNESNLFAISSGPEEPGGERLEAADVGLPKAVRWTTVAPPEDDPEEWPLAVFASEISAQASAIDPLLRSVIDEEVFSIIIAPPDCRWLYHPYDGGMDVVLPTSRERDALKDRFESWLSDHPLGL